MSPTAWTLVALLSLGGTGSVAASKLIRRRRSEVSAAIDSPSPAADEIAADALAAQLAHETTHHVKYTPHQRRRAVLRRAQEALRGAGRAEPPGLPEAVKRAVRLG